MLTMHKALVLKPSNKHLGKPNYIWVKFKESKEVCLGLRKSDEKKISYPDVHNL